MKVSLKTLALVGVLVCSAEVVEANRCCGNLKPRPNPKAVANRSACIKEETKGCPCAKPKPKQNQTSKSINDGCLPVMKGCPCNKPKPPVAPTQSVKSRVDMFRSASPAQQRSQLASQVNQYMSNPSQEMAEMLMGCADAYCMSMKNQSMNRLVKELMSSTNKKAVQMKIMRVLEV